MKNVITNKKIIITPENFKIFKYTGVDKYFFENKIRRHDINPTSNKLLTIF